MLLEMKHITKCYAKLVANSDVSIGLNEGELLAIVGENGAGKSTIMKILYGLELPDEGKIFLNGEKLNLRTPIDAIRNGIGMLHQHFMLFNSMSVAENIVYNNEQVSAGMFMSKRKNIEAVRELSQKYNLKVDPEAVATQCPVGVQQRVEILKILYQNANIIIFDEPSAVLTPLEVKGLLETLRNLVKSGKSVILITHKLQEVMAVADRVVVMRQGKVVGERMKAETDVEELSAMMIGRQIPTRRIPPVENRGRLLEVEGLSLVSDGGKRYLDNVNIHVDCGEVVGIAGVSGNGQSELVECIFGLKKCKHGSVRISGSDVLGKSVADIRKSGISLIPEDRYQTGSAKSASLEENVLIGREYSDEFCRSGVIRWKKVWEYTQSLIEQFKVYARSPKQSIGELSGGNAQKLIVAREMTLETPLLIAHEPIRGIDIGAIEFIHDKLVEKRNNGGGVLLVSSELSEIMDLCDRIYVIHNGRINGEFVRGEVDTAKLGLLMLGGKEHAVC